MGLNSIIYVCPKNFKSFHKFFAEQRRIKCKKKTLYRRKFFAYLFFIGENNVWIKKIYQEEMCGSRCSILIYIYLFNFKNFFWNLLLTERTILLPASESAARFKTQVFNFRWGPTMETSASFYHLLRVHEWKRIYILINRHVFFNFSVKIFLEIFHVFWNLVNDWLSLNIE